MKLLVGSGCNPRELNADDKPTVYIAVVRGFISVVEYLVSLGAPLPSRILFAAVQITPLKRVEMLRLLVGKGANVHVLSPEGHSLLQVAMLSPDRSVFLEIAQILIDAGCKPPALDLGGKTLLRNVAEQEYHQVGIYLLLYGTPSDILSLLDSNRLTKSAGLHSFIANMDGISFTPEEEYRLIEVVGRCLYNEDQYLDLSKKILAARGYRHLRSAGAELLEGAVRRGFCRVVEYLASRRVLLTPSVLSTAMNHHVSMVPYLIRKGAVLHDLHAQLDAFLPAAVYNMEEDQCLTTIQALAEASYYISQDAGQHLMGIAISRGFASVAEYLLSKRILLPCRVLFTALRCQVSMVLFLVGKGANLHAKQDNGDTLLHVAMSIPEEAQCHRMAQALVGSGCPSSTFNNAGTLPIEVAVSRGFVVVVEYLLSQRVPLPCGILFTALRDQTSIVPFLIREGADLHAKEENGDTLLHVAMSMPEESQCCDIVKVLVGAGCLTSASNAAGMRPIHTSISRGFISVVQYLLSRIPQEGLPPDMISSVSRHLNNSSSMVRLLVEHGANVTHVDVSGNGFLHHATRLVSEEECLEATKILIDAGCLHFEPNASLETPLHIAVHWQRGHISVANCLISHWHDVPLSDDILIVALKSHVMGLPRDWRQLLSLLIRRGANVNARKSNGDTTLGYAMQLHCDSETERL